MFNSQLINDLSSKINDIIKNSPLQEVEKNINALIRGAFTKMELVSRDEFEVQAEVLRKAREQLATLEEKLSALEVTIKQKQ
jgi:ubiquinone biosynthesis accessory factor UbiK